MSHISQAKRILHQLEKTSHEFWNIPRTSGIFLNLLVRERKFKTILEIGTSNGYSGIWFGLALKETGGRLYTIESHTERFALAKENFKKTGVSARIVQIFGHAPETIPATPKKFDLIFLDATKYEHSAYLDALKNRLKKGGMIIADNATTHFDELTDYFKIASSLFDSYLLKIGNGFFVSYRR